MSLKNRHTGFSKQNNLIGMKKNSKRDAYIFRLSITIHMLVYK